MDMTTAVKPVRTAVKPVRPPSLTPEAHSTQTMIGVDRSQPGQAAITRVPIPDATKAHKLAGIVYHYPPQHSPSCRPRSTQSKENARTVQTTNQDNTKHGGHDDDDDDDGRRIIEIPKNFRTKLSIIVVVHLSGTGKTDLRRPVVGIHGPFTQRHPNNTIPIKTAPFLTL
jgi:hypothetical protein